MCMNSLADTGAAPRDLASFTNHIVSRVMDLAPASSYMFDCRFSPRAQDCRGQGGSKSMFAETEIQSEVPYAQFIIM
jgi:hypothetical protein